MTPSRPEAAATRAWPIGLALLALVTAIVVARWLFSEPAARGMFANVGGAGNACTCSHRIEP